MLWTGPGRVTECCGLGLGESLSVVDWARERH